MFLGDRDPGSERQAERGEREKKYYVYGNQRIQNYLQTLRKLSTQFYLENDFRTAK